MMLLSVPLLMGTILYAQDAAGAAEPNRILNNGFELNPSGVKSQEIIDWKTVSEKDADADFVESGWTHSGQNKFTHWKATAFKVYTYQTVQELENGTYSFEFWYANGDGGVDCYVEVKDYGGDAIRIPVPKRGSWTKMQAKDIVITAGKCTIGVYSDAKAGYWINLDDFLLYERGNPPASVKAIPEEKAENFIVNGSFEQGDGKTFTGWQVVSVKDKDAAYREMGWTHSGDAKLTNWKDQDYSVYTYQTVKGLKNRTYALELWYANGGAQKNCYVEVKDFGGGAIRETLPTNPQWGRMRIANITVTNGACTIGVNTDAKAKYWINMDDFYLTPDTPYAQSDQVKFTTQAFPLSIKGIDLSTLPLVEAGGGKFYDFSGNQRDVFDILKENGINYVRLRIWNDPNNGICGRDATLAMAKRIKKAGMGFFLDFHYSDTWADPGKQEKPAAWKSLDFAGLNKAIYDYTMGIIADLKKQNTMPDMVQIGNEIRSGMLFPDGRITDAESFTRLAQLITSAAKGVKDALSRGDAVKIALHLDNGGDNEAYTYFFDNLITRGVQFDVIALSYYPEWHGKPSALYANIVKLAEKYKKELVIAETAYPFCLNNADGLENIMAKDEQLRNTGYPPTVAGQKKFLEDVIAIIAHAPNGKGLGFFYWEGAWLPVKGAGWDPDNPDSQNAWENQCLFNFAGYALDSLKTFRVQ
jgi:arabinogalactan endo-1,4-beta-galactosidase